MNHQGQDGTGQEIAATLSAEVGRRIDRLHDEVERMRNAVDAALTGRRVRVRRLTYAEVVRFFVEDRPHVPQAACGLVIRRRTWRGHLVYLTYLDRDEEIIVDARGRVRGKQLHVRGLDDELSAAFGRHDLMILV